MIRKKCYAIRMHAGEHERFLKSDFGAPMLFSDRRTAMEYLLKNLKAAGVHRCWVVAAELVVAAENPLLAKKGRAEA